MSSKKARLKDGDKARLGRQKQLGQQLRKLYDEIADEPIPDDFMKLLEDADKARSDD